MKKIFSIMTVGILLVGCGAKEQTFTTTLSDGGSVILEADGIEVSKDDIYAYVMRQYGYSQVLNEALQYVADQEITDKDAVEEKVNETIEQYAQYMEDGIEEYAKNLGYDSSEEYINEAIRPNAKQELLKAKYVDENYDTIVKDYQVRYLKTITVDTESAAQTIIDKSTSVEAFEEQFSDNGENSSDLGIVTNQSTSLDENIIDSLDSFTTDGIYSKAIKDSSEKYVVVFVYNSDISDLKDDIKTTISSITSIQTDYESFYLKKYKFEVYEGIIKDQIKAVNEDYLG